MSEENKLQLKVATPEMIEQMREDFKVSLDNLMNIIYTLDVRKDPNMYEIRQWCCKDLLSAENFGRILLSMEERHSKEFDERQSEETKVEKKSKTSKKSEGKDHIIEIKESLDIEEKV